MTKKKAIMSVKAATLKAWNDECEQCRINGIKEIIHMNTFVSRVRAYVNGGGRTSYQPLDSNIDRRKRELKEEGLINYDYDCQKEYYIVKPIKTINQ